MTQKTQIQNAEHHGGSVTESGSAVRQPQISNSDFDKLLEKERSIELSCFDSETFNQIYKNAEMMAQTGTIPDSLKKEKGKDLPYEKVVANCFLVAEQAHRWGISPYAIVGLASIVYGKLGWEGKLINGLIQKFTGIRLSFEFNDKKGDDLGVTVIGKFPNEDEPRTIQGTVKSWKTTGNGSPWVMSDEISLKRQLVYRGGREWKNIHAPGVMLGVMASDEIRDFNNNASATPVYDEPINPFGENPNSQPDQKAKESAQESTEIPENPSDSGRIGMIEEIKYLANKLGKSNGDWERLFDHYDISDLEEAKNIQLRSIFAKLKKETPEELDLEGGVE